MWKKQPDLEVVRKLFHAVLESQASGILSEDEANAVMQRVAATFVQKQVNTVFDEVFSSSLTNESKTYRMPRGYRHADGS